MVIECTLSTFPNLPQPSVQPVQLQPTKREAKLREVLQQRGYTLAPRKRSKIVSGFLSCFFAAGRMVATFFCGGERHRFLGKNGFVMGV